MKQEVKSGQTDYSVIVEVRSTTGVVATGLTSASISQLSYTRVETDNDVTVSDVTASKNDLASLTAAHNDWGFLEVSATSAAGLYRLDLADAVFATGAWSAVVTIQGSAIDTENIEFVMVPDLPYNGVNVSQWATGAVATPTVTGVPEVDVTHRLGSAVSGAEASVADIADGVWDEATSGHTTQGTYGELFMGVAIGTVAATGSSTTITLESGESSVDDYYNGSFIKISAGTGLGKRRWITDYVGSTRVATVDAAISTDLTSRYVII